jgi:hypothetical protein
MAPSKAYKFPADRHGLQIFADHARDQARVRSSAMSVPQVLKMMDSRLLPIPEQAVPDSGMMPPTHSGMISPGMAGASAGRLRSAPLAVPKERPDASRENDHAPSARIVCDCGASLSLEELFHPGRLGAGPGQGKYNPCAFCQTRQSIFQVPVLLPWTRRIGPVAFSWCARPR